MASEIEIEQQLAPLRLLVKEQGDRVRELKESQAPKADISRAVAELKRRKKQLEDKEKALNPPDEFNRSQLETLLKQRFFYRPSFSIYGGIAGLYDFGPTGCAMKNNLLQEWRLHFVLEEDMLEIESSSLAPEPVFKASGHLDRFLDYVVKDVKTGECLRADHLLDAHLEKLLADKNLEGDSRQEIINLRTKVESLSLQELGDQIKKFEVKSPVTGNNVSDPMPFNLMFRTEIGPSGGVSGYLRPETSQGMFVNFDYLLEYNQGKLPFAAAQIGSAFRNEVSPRSGLLRVREFTLGEIEYFYHPNDNDHFKFDSVADVEVTLFPKDHQVSGKPTRKMSIKNAVDEGVIGSRCMGYFLGRISLYLTKMGIDPKYLRFRQHMDNEMAHYATDCWDAECKTSYGWVECVGCANRSCYDLKCHVKATGASLCARETLKEPISVTINEYHSSKVGKAFKGDAKKIMQYFSNLDNDTAEKYDKMLKDTSQIEVDIDSKKLTISEDMIAVKRYEKEIHVVDITPSVIEPSFGFGRILYSILEHNFRIREGDEQRSWLSLPPPVAPVKCSVLPLSAKKEFDPYIKQLASELKLHGISNKVDDSAGSIGRRYARTDQIGIPYGITVDFDTVTNNPATVTLRERNTMQQIRLNADIAPKVVSDLVKGLTTWKETITKYHLFEGQESKK
ncbi:uncharacterized protein TRIADDRAFT_33686 [Trichoplax adhaerens]|uniref:Glycine--tRNA ligase n=1 Tax=Trichoplax adhaerens TaxID=10228 RepID=B3SD13_TRIAD|nr:hypothetical protein TRIADDRAFT_33686 [Trichoplax adhaerens]EDV19380.1 hypothetical protein TRIADDRAFT_33686 [Trichoplax adhaerens]|eukprot:XP_002118155.1 hypothetical protein TRIADDRAFT_33686 [Trichoplax adhaerens]